MDVPSDDGSERPKDQKYKVVLLGEAGVGKTAIFRRLRDGIFDEDNSVSTIGMESIDKSFRMDDGELVTLEIWDTGGAERFNSILTPSTYRKTRAAVFVYSVNDSSSFHYLTTWLEDVEKFVPTALTFLVGNKHDLSKEVEENAAQTFVLTNKMCKHTTTSAKTMDSSIEKTFLTIAKTLHEQKQSSDDYLPNSIDLMQSLERSVQCNC